MSRSSACSYYFHPLFVLVQLMVREVEWFCFGVSLTRVLLEPVLHEPTSMGDVKLRAQRFLSTFLSHEGLPAVTGAKKYLAVMQ